MSVRTALFSCVFAISLPSAVFAADPSIPESAYDWTGAYIGAQGGYVWSSADVSNMEFEGAPSGIPSFDVDLDGAMGGLTAGLNYQTGRVVFGLESDISLAWISGSDDTYEGSPGFTSEADLNWLSTLRARACITSDRILVYATGGLAIGEVEGTIHDDYGLAGIITTHDTTTHLGWTMGAGAEYALSDQLTLKAEYLYYDLGKEQMSFNEGLGGWNPMTAEVEVTGSVARIGANFRF